MTARTLPGKLSDFGPLTPAEQRVIAGLPSGHTVQLWPEGAPEEDWLPPANAGDDRRVRASLVRWLALGAPGDDSIRLHAHGLRIAGAVIASDGKADPYFGNAGTPGLDLEGCTLDRDLGLFDCRFEHVPVLLSARVQTLFLNGSHLPGLLADRLEARGNVTLDVVRVTGEARLLGAKLGGDLVCEGATFMNGGGRALSADRLEARGGVFLSGVMATGEVRLLGAKLGGNFVCVGSTFTNETGWALNANGARIEGGFFWRPDDTGKRARALGILDLAAAEIGHINDDPACWPERKGHLILNRCQYGAFTGRGISGAERIRWLALQDPSRFKQDFWPQPYEQCAKVLREMGHPEDARLVLIEKERLQRKARRDRMAPGWPRWRIRVWDGFLHHTIDYGHRPIRAAGYLLAAWLLGTGLFWAGYRVDMMKPANPVVLRSAEWIACATPPKGEAVLAPRPGEAPATLASRRARGETRADCYGATAEGAGYPAFNAPVYAADVLLPIVDFGQQPLWVPDERGGRGWLLKGLVYVLIAAGWVLTGLAVAGFTGIVKKD